jgi:hypothetical protein
MFRSVSPLFVLFVAVACDGPTEQVAMPDMAVPLPPVNQDLTCPQAVTQCSGLKLNGDGKTYFDPMLDDLTKSGDCAPTWTLRGCKCLPVRTIWDYDGTKIVDGGDSFKIMAQAPPAPPVYAATVYKNGVNIRWTVWTEYLIPSGTSDANGLTVPLKLADTQASFDTFKDCQ